MTNYTKKTNKCLPAKAHPELIELMIDLAIFTRKWQTPQIAKTIGISRQSLEKHIDRKEKITK